MQNQFSSHIYNTASLIAEIKGGFLIMLTGTGTTIGTTWQTVIG